MSADLPDYYFRVRENGAVVFRVDTENRQRRIDMAEIATVNVNNGKIKPHGDEILTREEEALIAEWVAERRAVLEARDVDDILRAVDHLNLTTQWVQSKASDEALEQVTDNLLMAMHDLRTVLVRKKAERILRAEGEGAEGEAE
jgi:hypothetical protein